MGGVAIAILMSTAVRAAPVTLVIEGTMDEYFDPDGMLPFANSGNGTPWTMRMTYESETVDFFGPDGPPVVPQMPSLGIFSSAITDISLQIGGQVFTKLESGTILILDDNNIDGSFVDGWFGSTTQSTGVGDFDPVIGDTPQSLVEGFGLSVQSPLTAAPAGPLDDKLLNPPVLGDWQYAKLYYSFSLQDNVTDDPTITLARASAQVTSISIVPLPAAVWFFGSALLTLVMRRKTIRCVA